MSKWADKLVGWLLATLALLLIAMTCLSVYNVVARYVFNRALLWADEIAVFGMIIITFLAAIAAAWRGVEIRMDILSNALPEKIAYWLRLLHFGVTAILCAWVTWLSFGYVTRLYNFGMTSDGARIPVWMVHSAIPIGFAMIALVSLVKLTQAIILGRSDKSLSAMRENI